MWRDNRFVAMSDPQRGGLHIAAASAGMEQSVLEEISDNCLELIAKDYNHPCTCVYALASGKYIVAMAMKISGNRKEARMHEIIRGVVLDKDEMNSFGQSYMSDTIMKEIFFPDNTDFDHPESWNLPTIKSQIPGVRGNSVDRMNGTTALGLYHALKEVQKKQMKIQLLVKTGTELQTLANLACMEKIAGTSLFILANGECTMKSPDILILDQAFYQDMRKYHKMTLEQFVHMGSNVVDDKSDVDTEIDFEQQKVNEILKFCLDYITEKTISDYDLYEAVDSFCETESYLFRRFIRRLRRELFCFQDVEFYAKRYIKLLYVAYKETGNIKQIKTNELESAPYDYSGMYQFLKKKSRSKRELKRLLVQMLEIQFQECAVEFNAHAVREAARNIVELV